MRKGYVNIFSAFLSIVILNGCSSILKQPIKNERASLGYATPQKSVLKTLPAPQEKIVCAVYNFRDQTGQYKPSETGASWSTAVTQGATSVLMRALEESNWFVIIERENISNLLNERKIIRSSRQQYGGNSNNQVLLPPLLYAGVILEGGIISYESNIRTGGAGVRYFGAGGSGEYREDRVSIYLRAVSSSNGKVLKTVYTTKSILSQKVSANLFRYVKLKRLLEAETGFTYNEPSHMAVKEAIEKAVISLILEGIEDNLWGIQNEADSTNSIFEEYAHEKELIASSDVMGQRFYSNQRSGNSLSLQGGMMKYSGDYKNDTYRGTGGLGLGFELSKGWHLNISASMGEYYADRRFNQKMAAGEMTLNYKLLPEAKLTPEASLGTGVAYFEGIDEESPQLFRPFVNSGVGFELMVTRNVGLQVSGTLNYLLSDKTDGVEYGNYNDLYITTQFGVSFYLGH